MGQRYPKHTNNDDIVDAETDILGVVESWEIKRNELVVVFFNYAFK